MTSSAEGRVTCSGIRQRVFALHTVLSKTSCGSRPSATTMFSFPMAVRCGQMASAACRPPSSATTCPASISFFKRDLSSAGSFSALVQLPVQCWSWILYQIMWVLLPLIAGRKLVKDACKHTFLQQCRQTYVWVLHVLCKGVQHFQPERLCGRGVQRWAQVFVCDAGQR